MIRHTNPGTRQHCYSATNKTPTTLTSGKTTESITTIRSSELTKLDHTGSLSEEVSVNKGGDAGER